MNTEKRYSVGELAQLADTTVRTIRYYTEEGLLPQPESEGKYAYYNRAHLDRLVLIKRLKDAFLPLREIRRVMLSLSDDEVSLKLTEPIQIPQETAATGNTDQPGTRALEYLRQIREARSDLRIHPMTASPDPAQGKPYYSQTPPAAVSPTMKYNLAQGQTWSRYPIADGVELNVREPLTPETESRVRHIVSYARKLYQTK